MTIDTAVAFTLRQDDGTQQTLWVAFENYDGWAENLSSGISNSFSNNATPNRAQVTGNATYWVADGAFDADVNFGISFTKPEGITHTIHTVDFNEEKVVLTDPISGRRKVGFTFKEFVDRYEG